MKKDIIGNEITVGCYVAFALIIGRSANLSIGRVTAIDNGKGIQIHSLKRTYGGCPNKPTWLSFPDRMIVLNEQDLEAAHDQGKLS